jgi:nucleotide-binding universal stress UspA family protein
MPLDLAADAAAALEYARQIGFVMNADLFLLLHVAKESVRLAAQPHTAMITARAGDPAQEIVRYADEIAADLIVMPDRRYGVVRQLLFGSTTMDVIRRTRRPVWVASRRSLKRPVPFSCRRIVCGIDIDAEALTVLKCASDLAATWNAHVMVVHASPEVSDATSICYGLGETGSTALPPQIALRRLLKRAIPTNVSFALEVSTGDAAEVLRKAARYYSADLVVIGRGIHTSAWQFGANIGNIISRVQCPVLTCDGRRSEIDVELALFGDCCLFSDSSCVHEAARSLEQPAN